MLHKKSFFNFFPTPNFLLRPAVGLDISDRSIRFVELIKKGGEIVLGDYGEKEIPEGALIEGDIKDIDLVKDVLENIKATYDFRFVRLSLSEQQSYLFKITLPRVEQNKLRENIEEQIAGRVPLPRESINFDYTIVKCGSASSADKQTIDVGVAVMPHAVIAQYLTLLTESGLVPLSFELEAHAITRAIVNPNDCGTIMIVDIGATRTGIAIVSDGIIQFTTTLNVGGNLLTEAIIKKFNIDFKEARELKERIGLIADKDEKLDMFSTLVLPVSTLRDEIKRYYIYWHTQKEEEHRKIEKIILCGGEANVPGLREYLSASLKEYVEMGNPWRNITNFENYIPEIPYNHSLRYTTALGLALNSFQ